MDKENEYLLAKAWEENRPRHKPLSGWKTIGIIKDGKYLNEKALREMEDREQELLNSSITVFIPVFKNKSFRELVDWTGTRD